jgi:hypothetical protein
VWCTVKLVDGILDKPATIGKPIHNTTAYILGMGRAIVLVACHAVLARPML